MDSQLQSCDNAHWDDLLMEYAATFKETDSGISEMQTRDCSQAVDEDERVKQGKMEVIKSLIVKCAEAIAGNDVKEAYSLVNTLREQASARGKVEERLAYYFAEALAAKTVGTGSMLFKALASQHPSLNEFFRAFKRLAEAIPQVGLPVFFTNQMILECTELASSLHVVDFGIGNGFRWLCLLKDLSEVERHGGSLHFRLTGVESPHTQRFVNGDELGVKLQRYAREVGVSFESHLITSEKWDELQCSDLRVHPGNKNEVLVVTSIYNLRQMRDEPRRRLLANINRMKPRLFIHAVLPNNCNSPSFISRVHAALEFYTGSFFALEDGFQADTPERQLVESMAGLDVLNALACPDEDRTERPECLKQWQSLTQRAGLKQVNIRPHVYVKATEMTQTYPKSFRTGRQGKWLLVYWKDSLQAAMSAWTTGINTDSSHSAFTGDR